MTYCQAVVIDDSPAAKLCIIVFRKLQYLLLVIMNIVLKETGQVDRSFNLSQHDFELF